LEKILTSPFTRILVVRRMAIRINTKSGATFFRKKKSDDSPFFFGRGDDETRRFQLIGIRNRRHFHLFLLFFLFFFLFVMTTIERL
jgi:hypothetical protein